MRLSVISNAALTIEADLKNMEKRLLLLKTRIARETISRDRILAEIDEIVEVLRA